LIKIPEKNFEDYLGKGFSGDVMGKRALIKKFAMSKFEFYNPIIAFPDTISIRHVKMVRDRAGSVGSEILKRFSVVFDYPNKKLFLKKNKSFYSPFGYNKSGIELQHYGLQWVQETFFLETIPIIKSDNFSPKQNENGNNFKYKFELKPVYIIVNVRKNSAAALSGLQKGDILVSINKIPAYKYTLEKINSLLKSEEEGWITIEIDRDSQLMKFRFKLLNVL
jgi:membrane-associated protease RseP (regulator of RpoE activity)